MNTAARNHPRKEPSLNNNTEMLPNFPWLIVGRETDFGYCCLNSFHWLYTFSFGHTDLAFPDPHNFRRVTNGRTVSKCINWPIKLQKDYGVVGRLIIREFKHLCLRCRRKRRLKNEVIDFIYKFRDTLDWLTLCITVSAIQKRNMEDSVKFVNEAEKNRRSSYRVIRMITGGVNCILRDISFVLHNKDSLDHVI